MSHRFCLSRRLGWLVCLGLFATPVLAHKVEVSGDVAGTWHIEPNHNPKAGEPAQVWVALTRQGGQIIPLNQCDCKLAVYPEPHAEGAAPLLEPPLKAISAEQYQGIPGVDVIFPNPGAYELELSGTPIAGANFSAFKMNYTVTVASGSNLTPESPPAKANPDKLADNQEKELSEPTPDSQPVQVLGGLLAVGMIGFGGLILLRRRVQK